MSLYGLDPDDMFDAFDRAKKAEEQVKELAALLREALPYIDQCRTTFAYRDNDGAELMARVEAALAKVGP
jgi:hypothetical protein